MCAHAALRRFRDPRARGAAPASLGFLRAGGKRVLLFRSSSSRYLEIKTLNLALIGRLFVCARARVGDNVSPSVASLCGMNADDGCAEFKVIFIAAGLYGIAF